MGPLHGKLLPFVTGHSLQQLHGQVLPDVITRFYMEISTGYNKNKIQIRSCLAAPTMGDLIAENWQNVVAIVGDYCEDQRFGIRHHPPPPGTTHIHRISVRKFQFRGHNTMYLQCVLEACALPPCGSCATQSFGDKAYSDKAAPEWYTNAEGALRSIRNAGQRAGYGRMRELRKDGEKILEVDTDMSHLPAEVRRMVGGVAAPSSGSGFMETTVVEFQIGRAMTPMMAVKFSEPIFEKDAPMFEVVSDRVLNAGGGAKPDNRTIRVAAAGNMFEPWSRYSTASGGAMSLGGSSGRQEYKNATAMPFVMTTSLTFSTLSVAWVGEHRRAVEATFKHVLKLDDEGAVNIIDIWPAGQMSAQERRTLSFSERDNFVGEKTYFGRARPQEPRKKTVLDAFRKKSAEKRLLQVDDAAEQQGAEVEFQIGLPEKLNAATSLNENLEKFASGDVQMLRGFVTRLDRELVTRGGYPKRLSPGTIAFQKPATKKISHAFLIQVKPWFSTSTTTTTVYLAAVVAEKPFLTDEVGTLILLGGGGFLGVLSLIALLQRLKREHSNRQARKVYGGKHLVVDLDLDLSTGGRDHFHKKVAPERSNEENGSPSPTSSTGSKPSQEEKHQTPVSRKKKEESSSSSSSDSD